MGRGAPSATGSFLQITARSNSGNDLFSCSKSNWFCHKVVTYQGYLMHLQMNMFQVCVRLYVLGMFANIKWSECSNMFSTNGYNYFLHLYQGKLSFYSFNTAVSVSQQLNYNPTFCFTHFQSLPFLFHSPFEVFLKEENQSKALKTENKKNCYHRRCLI